MFINLRPVLLTLSHTYSILFSLSLLAATSWQQTAEGSTRNRRENLTPVHSPLHTLGKDNGRGTPSSNDGAGSAATAAEPCGCLFQYVYAMLHALNRVRVFCVVLVVSLLQFPECSLDRSPSLSLFFSLSFFLSLSLYLSLYFNSSLCVF